MTTANASLQTNVVERHYDRFGRPVGVSLNGERRTEIAYDEATGRIASVSNADGVAVYDYAADGRDAGSAIRLPNGNRFLRRVARDDRRPELVTGIVSSVNDSEVESLSYAHDGLGRPVSRNDDTFAYNVRGELSEARISGFSETHDYDDIGNSTFVATAAETNAYVANSLNQYVTIRSTPEPPREKSLAYDADGNLLSDGMFTYAYDAENRLVSVSSNGALLAEYFYDARGRRVCKTTPAAAATFLYDGWNLMEEHRVLTNKTASTTQYCWGKDHSGRLQGAGGIGGLLYLKVDEEIYVPLYDANSNITKYLDAAGNVVASYGYSAFGNVTAKTGLFADKLAFRFSTKYYDDESGFFYYGKRFYSPMLCRWINRDPIDEDGGVNLYGFCSNRSISSFDKVGTDIWVENTTAVYGLHQRVCVTTWEQDSGGKYCCNGVRYRKAGKSCISFGVAQGRTVDTMDSFSGDGGSSDSDGSGDSSVSADEARGKNSRSKFPKGFDGPNQNGDGQVYRDDRAPSTGIGFKLSTDNDPCFDMDVRDYMDGLVGQGANYSLLFQNCRSFSQAVFNQCKGGKGK